MKQNKLSHDNIQKSSWIVYIITWQKWSHQLTHIHPHTHKIHLIYKNYTRSISLNDILTIKLNWRTVVTFIRWNGHFKCCLPISKITHKKFKNHVIDNKRLNNNNNNILAFFFAGAVRVYWWNYYFKAIQYLFGEKNTQNKHKHTHTSQWEQLLPKIHTIC